MPENAVIGCSIVSPLSQTVVDGVSVLVVSALNGELGILPDHVATVAGLKPGSAVRVSAAGGERHFRIGTSSFLRFSDNSAVILTADFEEEAIQ